MDDDELLGHRLPKTPQEAACLQVSLLKSVLRELRIISRELRAVVDKERI